MGFLHQRDEQTLTRCLVSTTISSDRLGLVGRLFVAPDANPRRVDECAQAGLERAK